MRSTDDVSEPLGSYTFTGQVNHEGGSDQKLQNIGNLSHLFAV